jgi:hypothetical protein
MAAGARHTLSALHTTPAPQSLSWLQGSSGNANAAHTPHAAFAVRAQRVLAHCASLPHAWPFARAPGASRQASGNALCSSASQSTAGNTAAQPARPALVLALSGKCRANKQLWALRAVQLASSPYTIPSSDAEQLASRAHNTAAYVPQVEASSSMRQLPATQANGARHSAYALQLWPTSPSAKHSCALEHTRPLRQSLVVAHTWPSSTRSRHTPQAVFV